MDDLPHKSALPATAAIDDAVFEYWLLSSSPVTRNLVGAISVARALPEGAEAQAMLEAALQQVSAVIDGRQRDGRFPQNVKVERRSAHVKVRQDKSA